MISFVCLFLIRPDQEKNFFWNSWKYKSDNLYIIRWFNFSTHQLRTIVFCTSAFIFLFLPKAWNFTIRCVSLIIPPEYWSTVVVIIPHLIFQRFFSKARTIELCWLINYFFCSKTLTLQYVEKKGNHLIKFGYSLQNKAIR